MRIMYFGENKEEGTERVAVIRFTDDEFDLYKYIENYEHTYGDNTREFANGGLIGIERNEKGVWINESYISVDDFSDFNDFKANYKEAKKEFKSLKKQATETEPETTDSETADQDETAEKNEFEIVDENDYTKLESELIEPEDTHIDDIKKFKEKAVLNSSYEEATEPLTVYQFERLTGTLYKSLFKAIGLEETRKIPFIISNNMVFFNYNGVQYKYYPSQCKIFKKFGRKYQRINWKDFAEENNSDGQKQFSGRSPPFTPDIRSVNIDKFKIEE